MVPGSWARTPPHVSSHSSDGVRATSPVPHSSLPTPSVTLWGLAVSVFQLLTGVQSVLGRLEEGGGGSAVTRGPRWGCLQAAEQSVGLKASLSPRLLLVPPWAGPVRGPGAGLEASGDDSGEEDGGQ